MKWLTFILALGLLPLRGSNDYRPGPDSFPQTGVPRGTVTPGKIQSRVFSGALHDYWVYVPAQYDGTQPACLLVCQDGGGFADANGGFRAPVVLDNLIHKKEIPVTIGIFVSPGVIPSGSTNQSPRPLRSLEYETLNGDYARFLVEELIPLVGQKFKITSDPNGRAVCGASSGGIAAFTAAWERPDQFRRVVSFIGSFVNLRSGHSYPSLIRKTEPKPIRVYLQDGRSDQDINFGSWFLANQDLAAALALANYDYTFVTGDGGHDGVQATAIFPDALRWVWRDYPRPIERPALTPRHDLSQVIQGPWTEVQGVRGYAFAVDAGGAVFVTNNRLIVRLQEDAMPRVFAHADGRYTSLAFGPHGRLFAADPEHARIAVFDTSGQELEFLENFRAHEILLNHQGMFFAVDRRSRSLQVSLNKKGFAQLFPPAFGAMAFSTDQGLLLQASESEPQIWSSQIFPDGAIKASQPYYILESSPGRKASSARSLAIDARGRLFAATDLGVQVLEPAGRVIGIVENPPGGPVQSIAFGGTRRDDLYAISGGKIFRRKMSAPGAAPFAEPFPAPPARL